MRCVRKLLTLLLQNVVLIDIAVVLIDIATLETASFHVCVLGTPAQRSCTVRACKRQLT